ncbi:histidine phosphatase family protein [Paenibacillus sedimenti]|uniref:Histidine phosphatase family protein n=1 Tax=Paenibacillus sedimenti TaxID=2770274 RepID=A0A926KXR3_9BACL|nr:histidine phosphatase family protein [Paenibacillus sedimenti]MBD0384801.1 histidine phosphatase family protein [Paenibacillus sedimenti]
MKTFIYMVRHGESPKMEGNERTRGLTLKGESDAQIVAQLLKDEGIDTFISSPYKRAILTIEGLAQSLGKEMIVIEELKEVVFIGDDKIMPDQEVYPLVKKMFSDPDFSLSGGESFTNCQKRVVTILKNIISEYKGQKVAIGTHGAVMTMMMGYFDPQFDLDFLLKTSKPDIYKMEIDEGILTKTERLWRANLV